MADRLPIETALPDLISALREHGQAALQAPPGAGKTTRVPLALLEAGVVSGRILMLEPRRLATRGAALRMAETLGENVGKTVGYRMRGETKVSDATRIEVVTEGILTRMIQSDPTLDGIGAVIFDEFHERSLNADLGLALALASFALRDEIVFFFDPTEVVAGEKVNLGDRFRIGGLVADGSVMKESTRVVFTVTDGANNVEIVYDGILPDLFREGQGVIAEGVLETRQRFVADNVLAKHDENYIPKELEGVMKEKGVWKGEGEE